MAGGDIDFLGIVNSAGTMNILDAHNITVHDVSIYVQHFNQYAGSGTISFGNDSLHVLGDGIVTIVTRNANGHIEISYGSLFLDVDYANLFGSIAGDTGISNI